jgi:uncharacterized damage-inducible protein DinB
MVSERSAEIADDFAAANAEVLAFVRSCSEEQWLRTVPGEGWTVGVVLHHVAEGHEQGLRWLDAMAQGDGVADTAEGIDRVNAAHAERAEGVGPAETLVLLESNAAQLESALRALTDEELDRCATFGPAGGRELPTVDLAVVSARHAREHLAHAREAVNGQA